MKHDLNSVDPLTKLGAKLDRPLTEEEWWRASEQADQANARADFAKGDHGRGITEADCRQIKPKAQYLPCITAVFSTSLVTQAELERALYVCKEQALAQFLRWVRSGVADT